MIDKIRLLSRSLFAQLVLLSAVAFVAGVVFLIWLPLQDLNENYSPMTYTRNLVIQELTNARRIEGGIDALESSVVIAEVANLNPNLRAYIESRGESFTLGAPPRWRDYMDMNHPDFASSQIDDDDQCMGRRAVGASSFIDEVGAIGSFLRYQCGEESYFYEVAGVENPVSRADNPIGLFPSPLFWDRLNTPAYIAAAMLITSMVVAGLGFRSIRRITKIAGSFDPEVSETVLPDQGVPAEVLPLVKALNGMLAKVREARDQQRFFLATAAHEIRTPLAIMRVRLEELPDSESRTELREDMRRLNRLVEDLLRLLELHDRDQPDDPVDLAELAREVVANLAPVAVGRGVDIGVEAEIESVVVRGDERLLRVAFSNLVDNAISFSGAGDTIDIAVRKDGELIVRDHGPGIPPEKRSSIFRPFAKNPPNRQGHGLGLAIVWDIVKLHGGSIRVEETPGGGATFVMNL